MVWMPPPEGITMCQVSSKDAMEALGLIALKGKVVTGDATGPAAPLVDRAWV
jgi:hypothetical protein